jgi:hypothetical protein
MKDVKRRAYPWRRQMDQVGAGRNRAHGPTHEGRDVSGSGAAIADDVAALNRSLDRTEGPVVLAGHANAGAVMAPVRERAKALVYVTALPPTRARRSPPCSIVSNPIPKRRSFAPGADGLI